MDLNVVNVTASVRSRNEAAIFVTQKYFLARPELNPIGSLSRSL
jgi:hypothetical protein